MATSTATHFESADRTPGSSETAWSDSYAGFLAAALANVQKTLRLYQLALEHVASGRLPTSVFQEYYPRFVQRHGAAYAERLAQLGAEFMGRLAALNQRSAGSAGSGGEEIRPPVFQASTPERWLEQFADYSGKLGARALQAYRIQLDRVAAGELSPEDMQQHIAADLSRQFPYYAHDAARLYLELMRGLGDLRSRYEEEYFNGILALAAGTGDDSVSAVVLQAPLGEVGFKSFTITNTTDARMPIRCVATEVRRMDGVGAAFAPKVAVTPETLELDPGAEARITFSIHLEADRYTAGIPYIGYLYLGGEADRHVDLQLRIIATAPEPEARHDSDGLADDAHKGG